MTVIYQSNKNWSLTLRLAGFICFIVGLITILEPSFEKKSFKQKCVGKESTYNNRLDTYSYRLTFESGHQYVDPDVFDLVNIDDTVLFKCTPFHYQIVEFIFNKNFTISNVRNYYAQIGFGIFYAIMGSVLLFFKFKKDEHLIIWSCLIGFVLIFVLIDISHLVKGNPYGSNSAVDINNTPTINNKSSSIDSINSSNDEIYGDFMMKIIEKKIQTPMDSATALKCFDFLKINYSLMMKLLNEKNNYEETINISGENYRTLIMTNFLVCENAIDLLEKSENVLNKNIQNELIDFKEKIKFVNQRVIDLYLETNNSKLNSQ